MGQKTDAEFRAEAITLALLVLVAGAFALGGNLTEPLALLAVGLILLGSAIYQSRRGWPVSWITWALGILLTLGGLGLRVFLVAVMRVNWLAIGLLVVGALALYQAVSRRG